MATEPTVRERRKIERWSGLTLFGRRWYFRGRGKNGEIVVWGEAYNSPQARDRGIKAAREIFAVGKIVDV